MPQGNFESLTIPVYGVEGGCAGSRPTFATGYSGGTWAGWCQWCLRRLPGRVERANVAALVERCADGLGEGFSMLKGRNHARKAAVTTAKWPSVRCQRLAIPWVMTLLRPKARGRPYVRRRQFTGSDRDRMLSPSSPTRPSPRLKNEIRPVGGEGSEPKAA